MPSLSLKASINYPFVGGASVPSPILNGLIHYWNFNDTINVTSGSAWYSPQAGNIYLKKRLYNVNGTTSYIGPTNIGSYIRYLSEDNFSIEAPMGMGGSGNVLNWGINQGILGNSTHAGIIYQGEGPQKRFSNCLYSTNNNESASANIQALGTNFTINFWAKFDVTGAALGDVLIGKVLRELGSSSSFSMGFQGNNILVVASDNLLWTNGDDSYNGVVCSLPNYENFSDNIWRMITFVCDGNQAVFYLNASSDNGNGDNSNIAQILGPIDASALPLNINYDAFTFYTATDCLYSAIDEFGIWNRALTESEILSLYNNGIGKAYPF